MRDENGRFKHNMLVKLPKAIRLGHLRRYRKEHTQWLGEALAALEKAQREVRSQEGFLRTIADCIEKE